MLTQKLQEI